jgi:RNA polymerase sigma-70 factor (ECF subfamily)
VLADRAPTGQPSVSAAAEDPVALAVAASLVEPERFEAVFEAHHGAVWAYLARRAGRDAADDLAGDVFAIAFARRASFDAGLGTVRSWLFGIAANLLRTRRRSDERAGRAFERLTRPGAVQLVSDDLATDEEGRQELHGVARAVAGLAEADRELLLLFAWDELSYDEIAAVLDVPIGTVRSRLSRARQRLRELAATAGQVPMESSPGRTFSDG